MLFWGFQIYLELHIQDMLIEHIHINQSYYSNLT